MYQKILIENLQINTFIGAYSQEKKKIQKIIINLEIFLNKNMYTNTDDLDDVTDYGQFRRIILEITQDKYFNLLETLADTISKKIKQNMQVKGIRLKITKPDIFRDCSVSYEISDYL